MKLIICFWDEDIFGWFYIIFRVFLKFLTVVNCYFSNRSNDLLILLCSLQYRIAVDRELIYLLA